MCSNSYGIVKRFWNSQAFNLNGFFWCAVSLIKYLFQRAAPKSSKPFLLASAGEHQDKTPKSPSVHNPHPHR